MKLIAKNKTVACIYSALLMPAFSFAADYYYTASSNLVWSNSSYDGWSVKSGDTFVAAENPPSLDDNLYFDPANYTSNRLYLNSSDSYYVKDIYVKNSSTAETLLCWDTKTDAQSTPFNASGTLYVTGASSSYDFQFIYADSSVGDNGAPKLDVTLGGIWMSADGTTSSNVDKEIKARLLFGSTSKLLNSLTVNGNVDLYSFSTLSTYAETVKISGVISFHAKDWSNNAGWIFACVENKNIRYEIGGLSAEGEWARVMGSGDVNGASNTIVFNNAADTHYVYKGKIADSTTYGAASYAHVSKLNLEMNGEGIQEIMMQDMNNCFITGTVTVNNGTLRIRNGVATGDLYLNNGVFGVANRVEKNNKYVTTGVHWKGGMLELEVCSGKDVLVVEGAFERDAEATGKLMFDIDFIASDFEKLDNGEVEYLSYNLLTADSLKGFSDLNSELGLYALDSKYEATFSFADGVLSTAIKLAAVPEAAEVATLFGIIALGFVAYRRRK